MRRIRYAFYLTFILLLSCNQRQQERVASHTQSVHSLDALGSYTKAVALETHENALLGSITKVEVDPNTGDILVADTFVTHKVYRFSSKGRFLRAYGGKGEGPGEYQRLFTFTLHKSRVALFSLGKRLLFEADGRLVLEDPSYTNDVFAQSSGDRIFVYSLLGYRPSKNMAFSLDENFEIQERFHPIDKRIRKIPFLPNEGLAVQGNQIVLSEFCDYELALYDRKGNYRKTFRFPNGNHELDPLWRLSKDKLTKNRNRKKITQSLHRASAIHTVNGYLHILESHPENQILRSNLWDLETHQLYTYEGIRLVRAGKDADYLSMNQLVGAYNQGLIGVCDDPENFHRFKHQIPAAQGIEFTDNDNPVLLFFELKKPVTATAKL